MTTRQRLLELHRRCPECKPELLRCNSLGFWFLNVTEISESTAFALARDAMDTYLAVHHFAPKVSFDGSWFTVEIARRDLLPEIQEFTGEDKTDALISAVEAVMENK